MTRACAWSGCDRPLLQHDNEPNGAFSRRRFCDRRCAACAQFGGEVPITPGGPEPGYRIPDWHDESPCREVGPELFDPAFPDLSYLGARVCASCPFGVGGLQSRCVRDGFEAGDAALLRAGRSMKAWRRLAGRAVAS